MSKCWLNVLEKTVFSGNDKKYQFPYSSSLKLNRHKTCSISPHFCLQLILPGCARDGGRHGSDSRSDLQLQSWKAYRPTQRRLCSFNHCSAKSYLWVIKMNAGLRYKIQIRTILFIPNLRISHETCLGTISENLSHSACYASLNFIKWIIKWN